MAEPVGLLDAESIRAYLLEVADVLGDDGPPCLLVIGGGSLLALHDLRASTWDIDSITKLDEPLREAASIVAARHGLSPHWLNDRAAMFWPAGLNEAMCSTVLQHRRLLVLEPPLRFIFVMKLEANRIADQVDMRKLWPQTGFANPQEAADLWHAAYPHHDPDPYLADYVAQLIR